MVLAGLNTTVLPATSAPPAGPGREREREVERRDHGPHAVRPQHAGVSLARAERAHLLLEPVVRLDLVAVVRHQVGRLLDVADAFEAVLAGLVAHDGRQLPPVIADRVGHGAHLRDALAPGQRGPRRARPRVLRRPPPSRARARRSGSGRESTACRWGSRPRTSSPAVTGCPLMNIGCVWPNCFLTSTIARIEGAVQIHHLLGAHRAVGDLHLGGFHVGFHEDLSRKERGLGAGGTEAGGRMYRLSRGYEMRSVHCKDARPPGAAGEANGV